MMVLQGILYMVIVRYTIKQSQSLHLVVCVQGTLQLCIDQKTSILPPNEKKSIN